MSKDAWQERRGGPEVLRARDARTPFERDRSRVLHCASFRRLQGKTQVLGITEGDFHRTRLTHSMEVAQIARGLVIQLIQDAPQHRDILPPLELIEAIAFAHDLGHPPFGHGGEIALNYMMRRAGGFEGNGQSLRLVASLESNHPMHGLDLTRRTLLGILKYPAPLSEVQRTSLVAPVSQLSQVRAEDWKPPKCYLDTENELVDWILEPLPDSDKEQFRVLKAKPATAEHGETAEKSFDCSLMELADDIAYGVHDFEDGVALGLIPIEAISRRLLDELDSDWAREVRLDRRSTLAHELLEPASAGGNRKKAIGALVHAMISSVRIAHETRFKDPLLAYRAVLHPEASRILKLLKGMAYKYMIDMPSVQTLEYRGRQIVMAIFEALEAEPQKLLTSAFRTDYNQAASDAGRLRAVCDYIAGMTDSYASRVYERLFVPRQGSVFERL